MSPIQPLRQSGKGNEEYPAEWLYPLGPAVSALFKHMRSAAAQAQTEYLQQRTRAQSATAAKKELETEIRRGAMVERSSFLVPYAQAIRTAGLPMRPIKYLVFEEVSRLPLMAMGPRTTEGDVLPLAKVRTSTFGAQAKVIYSSSPVEPERCRVSALFEDSTQEYWYSKCPRGHFQILGLAEVNFETGCCRCLTCGLEYDQAAWQESLAASSVKVELEYPVSANLSVAERANVSARENAM